MMHHTLWKHSKSKMNWFVMSEKVTHFCICLLFPLHLFFSLCSPTYKQPNVLPLHPFFLNHGKPTIPSKCLSAVNGWFWLRYSLFFFWFGSAVTSRTSPKTVTVRRRLWYCVPRVRPTFLQSCDRHYQTHHHSPTRQGSANYPKLQM